MRKTKREFLFDKLQEYIHREDHTSIAHVLQWEYRKEELFDLKNDEGLTIIHIACFEGQMKCLEEFLKNGASANLRSSVGWTPLHAATLGGKLEIVEYLLSECSADPVAKDEMGCVPSDLTMDSDILHAINRFADELRIRRDLERLAGIQAAEAPQTPRKRNTISFELVENDIENGLIPSRAHSMFLNQNEAKQIREHFSNKNKTNNNALSGARGLLEIPEQLSIITNDNYLVRHNSAPVQRSPTIKASEERERHNSLIIESASEDSEPGTPRATRFHTQRTQSLRDSGVFDEETDMDSLTDQLIKKKLSSSEHYNII